MLKNKLSNTPNLKEARLVWEDFEKPPVIENSKDKPNNKNIPITDILYGDITITV